MIWIFLKILLTGIILYGGSATILSGLLMRPFDGSNLPDGPPPIKIAVGIIVTIVTFVLVLVGVIGSIWAFPDLTILGSGER